MDVSYIKMIGKKLDSNLTPESYPRVSFSLLCENGEVATYNRSACYNALNDDLTYYDDDVLKRVNSKPILLINKIMENKIEEPNAKDIEDRFFHWLMNESNWAYVFDKSIVNLTSDIQIVRTDVPSNMMVSALFATRMTSENGERMGIWWDMVERGVDPHVSILLSLNLKKNEDSLVIQNTENTNHNCLSWLGGVITSLVKNKPSRLDLNYRDRTVYRNVNSTWSGVEDGLNYHILNEFLDSYTKTTNKTSKNPFGQGATRYEYRDAMDFLAEKFNERIALL